MSPYILFMVIRIMVDSFMVDISSNICVYIKLNICHHIRIMVAIIRVMVHIKSKLN